MAYAKTRAKKTDAITPELVYELASKGNFRSQLPEKLGISRTTCWKLLQDRPELEEAYVAGEMAALEGMESDLFKSYYVDGITVRDKIAVYAALSRYKLAWRTRLEKSKQAQVIDIQKQIDACETEEELEELVQRLSA